MVTDIRAFSWYSNNSYSLPSTNCGRYCPKHFTSANSFYPHNSPLRSFCYYLRFKMRKLRHKRQACSWVVELPCSFNHVAVLPGAAYHRCLAHRTLCPGLGRVIEDVFYNIFYNPLSNNIYIRQRKPRCSFHTTSHSKPVVTLFGGH